LWYWVAVIEVHVSVPSYFSLGDDEFAKHDSLVIFPVYVFSNNSDIRWLWLATSSCRNFIAIDGNRFVFSSVSVLNKSIVGMQFWCNDHKVGNGIDCFIFGHKKILSLSLTNL
jgi:hypothetical protein